MPCRRRLDSCPVTFFDWGVLGPSAVLLCGVVLALAVDRLVPRRTWLGSGLVASAAVVVAYLVAASDGHDSLCLLGALGVLLVANVVNHEESMPPATFHALVLVCAAGAVAAERSPDVVGAVAALTASGLAGAAMAGVRTGDAAARSDARDGALVVLGAGAVSLVGALLVRARLDERVPGGAELGQLGWFAYAPGSDAVRLVGDLDVAAAAGIVLVAVLPLVLAGAVPFGRPAVVYPRASVVVAGLLATVPVMAGARVLAGLARTTWAMLGQATLLPLEVLLGAVLVAAAVGVVRAGDLLGLLRWTTLGTTAVAVAAHQDEPGDWLLVQVLAVVGVVGMLAVAARRRGGVEPDRLRGLVRTEPLMGVSVLVALLARAGLPPTWAATTSAVDAVAAGWDAQWFLGVTVAAYLAAAVVAVLRAAGGLVAPPAEPVHLSPSPPVSVRVATTTVVLAALALLLLPLAV